MYIISSNKTIKFFLTVSLFLLFLFGASTLASAEGNVDVGHVIETLVERGFPEDFLNSLDEELIMEYYNDESHEYGGSETRYFEETSLERGAINPSIIKVVFSHTTKSSNGKVNEVTLINRATWNRTANVNFGEHFGFAWNKSDFGYVNGSFKATLQNKNNPSASFPNTGYRAPSVTKSGFQSFGTKQKLIAEYPTIIIHRITLKKVTNKSGTLQTI